MPQNSEDGNGKTLERPTSGQTFLFHPFSGMLIIALDWLFFGIESATLGLSIPVTSFLAFVTTFLGVSLIQINLARDNWVTGIAKGLLGGILAGIPTAISGTALGALILAWSGISRKK